LAHRAFQASLPEEDLRWRRAAELVKRS